MFLAIVLGVFIFLGIIIGQVVPSNNLRLVYWLLMFLLFITICNIHISITYYKKLREDPGVKGPRGDPGEQGPKGTNGVCSLSTNCNINDCRSFVEKILTNMDGYPGTEYRMIKNKMSNSQILTPDDKKKLRQINDWVDILTNICSKQEYNKVVLENYIKDSFKTGSFNPGK